MDARDTMAEKNETIVAVGRAGYVTKRSRTPRRARGVFVPPLANELTPRRSPRLLAKRRRIQDDPESSVAALRDHDYTTSQALAPSGTPVRLALRKKVGEAGNDDSGEPAGHVFREMVGLVRKEYSHLTANTVTAEADGKLSRYVIVTRNTKVDSSVIGPHDALRLVVDESGQYKCWVYDTPTEEGTLPRPASSMPFLERMNTQSWVVCPGIQNYSTYKANIGYEQKRVKSCSWPTDVARDVECAVWYEKGATKKSDLCDKCTHLKWRLVCRSKEHEGVSAAQKRERQGASSRYPFDYLSPESKKAKVENLRRAVSSLRGKSSSGATEVERTPVSEVQNEEISELIYSVHESEDGQRELQKIFAEAEESGEGRGQMVRDIWEADVADVKQFFEDQKNNVTGRASNRWSSVTIRLALAIFSRSPASFRAVRSLGILQLPCDKTLRKFMDRHATSPGIDEEALMQHAEKYDVFKAERAASGLPIPVGEGVLIWDEVKVQSRVVWNSANSAIVGFAMSSDDFAGLHDVYQGLETDEKCQKTSYVIQFLWRDLSSEFDVIGPYFTIPSTMETKFLHSVVSKTMLAFSQYGFSVRALLCDGASSNLSLLKLMCGALDDSALISPWFESPFDGKRVFLIVCPSHQLKNMIAALYSSRTDGTKEFQLDGVTFGWETIEKVYQADMYRAKAGITRRVPGLKYSHIVRDSWTRLNVLPAKIMQQPYMITAVEEMAAKDHSPTAHITTAKYLKACNKLFEEGILSHGVVDSMEAMPIKNMEAGYQFFAHWRQVLASSDPEVSFRSPLQRSFLAWQTWDLLEIMYKGFHGLCEYFVQSHPGYFISPLRVNGSALESVFSCLKYIAGGNLASTNYATSLAAFSTQREVKKNPYSEKGYRDESVSMH